MATYIQIGSTVTVGASPQANIEFTSIPADYTDLKVVLSTRSSSSAVSDNCWMRFNANNSSYVQQVLYGDGSSAQANRSSGNADTLYLAPMAAATAVSNTFSNTEIYIPNYAGSTNKNASLDGAGENNISTVYYQIQGIRWTNTAAITSIRFGLLSGQNFVQYSSASLYGIKNS
jgi:hypothetical protein